MREFPPPPPAFGVGQDPDKVKLESRVMGDYSARFGEHNYDHSSSKKLDSIFERGRMKTCRSQSLWDYCT